MILFFERSKSLTHKIDKLLNSELKSVMPYKYYSFRVLNWLSMALFFIFAISFFSYCLLSIYLQEKGVMVEASMVNGFANVILYSCLTAIICWFLRIHLYKELEQHLICYWNSMVNGSSL